MNNEPSTPGPMEDASCAGEHALKICGTLDAQSTPALEKLAESNLAKLDGVLRLDCSDLAFIDSAGLGALIALHRKLALRGIRLELLFVPSRVLELLHITKLDSVLSITPERRGAASLSSLGLETQSQVMGRFSACWQVRNCEHFHCPNYGTLSYTCWNTPHAPCKPVQATELADEIVGCVNCQVYQMNVGHFAEIQEHFEEYIRVAEQAFAKLRGEKEQLSEQVEQQRAMLAAMVEQSSEYIFACDARGRVILWNPSLAILTGRQPSAVPDIAAAVELISSEPSYASSSLLAFLSAGLGGSVLEHTTRDAGGAERSIAWSALTVRGIQDNVLGTFVLGRDITEFRHAQEALARSEHQHRFLTDNITDGLLLVLDGTIRYINPAFRQMLGYANGELEGKALIELIAPERQGLIRGLLSRPAANGRPQRYETVMLREDETEVQVEVTQTASDFRGEPAKLLMVRDLSIKRRLLAYERLLPVCSECGSVRDDTDVEAGTGPWRSMEEFLQAAVEKPITHSLCPHCAARAVEQLYQ